MGIMKHSKNHTSLLLDLIFATHAPTIPGSKNNAKTKKKATSTGMSRPNMKTPMVVKNG
jgi:hypothetical protein